MKYIILGKSLKQGTTGNDSGDLSVYFELGWEIVGSRIDIINLINSKNFDEKNTILVTSEDRKFLYTSFYKKTITYDEFSKLELTNESVEDWTKIRNFRFLNAYNNFVDLKTKKYINFERDYELLYNGYDLSESKYEKIKDKFVVIALRYRDHNSHKNAINALFEILVKKIKEHITKNIYIVGYGSEEFCKKNDCIYIDRLVDYVSLIKNKNCISLISQSTGTLCLALMSSEAHIQLIDHAKCSDINGDNAVLGGKCVHFFKNGITPYYELNEMIINQIFQKTKDLCMKN